MKNFYDLKIANIRSLTNKAVEIMFDVPESLQEKFQFQAGQYITIRSEINGEDVRRSYSLCSSPESGDIAVGVKRIREGKMSTFLTRELKIGDTIQVMPPNGNFLLQGQNVVGICAGSGITPIFSMIKSQSDGFTLVYGNQSQESAMFLDEIISIGVESYFVYSREDTEDCYSGRINNNILLDISKHSNLLNADHYFICGPGEMIVDVESFLLSQGVNQDQIHFEKFTSVIQEDITLTNQQDEDLQSNVTVIIDGDEFEYNLSQTGETILDSAMREGADVPFSCKGAVCCTCKAKVIKGEVKMDQNFSLSDDEVEEGYILACQAHPITDEVIVDFDEM